MDSQDSIGVVGTASSSELAGDAVQKRDWASLAGVVLTLGVFPLWLLTGALFKLFEGNARQLPVILIKMLSAVDIDLLFVLHFAVSVELAFVGLIWLLPRLARPLALVMAGIFAPILIGDLFLGAASCGCFGSVEVPPVVTLAMDGGLFFGILLLGRETAVLKPPANIPLWSAIRAFVWIVCAFAIGFGAPTLLDRTEQGAATTQAVNAGIAKAQQIPDYYVPDYTSWIGGRWEQTDIAPFIIGSIPLEQGPQYLLFYRKDCEHCHELMLTYFTGTLAVPTTLIAVPERDGFPTAGVLEVPCTDCATAELPSGCDWFLQTPVLVRLNGGIVECAAEVDVSTPQCLF